MATYKTPDVYIKEISIFPPSVAEVETAIPCFIGYTEKAKKIKDDDLLMKAEKIKSIVEFEELYGGGPDLENITVTLDDTNNASEVDLDQDYYLYDSLRMFFSNGGGKCYIVSVGLYGDEVIYGDEVAGTGMITGLRVLKKEDEPTMIVFPDAVELGDKLYNLQQQALIQANNLQDRVVICDLKNTGNLDDDVSDFRGKVGINNLKYGAAYVPWLKTSLPKTLHFRNIGLQRASGSPVLLENLTSDTDIKQIIADLRMAISEYDDVENDIIEAIAGAGDSLKDAFNDAIDDYDNNIIASSTNPAIRNALRDIYTIFNGIAETWIAFSSGLTASNILTTTDLDNIISNYDLDNELQTLIYHSNGFGTSATGTTNIMTDAAMTSYVSPVSVTPFGDVVTGWSVTDAGDGSTIDGNYSSATDDVGI